MKKTAIAIFALSLAGPALASGYCVNGAGNAVDCSSKGVVTKGTTDYPTLYQTPMGNCLDLSAGKITEDGGLCAAEPTTWHLLTKSRGGTVSLIKGLTGKECKDARMHAMALPYTDEEMELIKRGTWAPLVSSSDIVSAECFE